MSDEKKARGMMAAHLTDEVGIALRGGDASPMVREVLRLAGEVLEDGADAVRLYRRGLMILGPMVVNDAALDAAVAAIERGEWPETSLVGQVFDMKRRVENEMPRAMSPAEGAGFIGTRNLLDHVLSLLGVKP